MKIRHLIAAAVVLAYTILCLTVFSSIAHCDQVSLAWDANEPPVTNYRIYMRTNGDEYGTQWAWEGTATTCTVITPVGETVYFVARASLIDPDTGVLHESDNSNEVVYYGASAPGTGPRPPTNVRRAFP